MQGFFEQKIVILIHIAHSAHTRVHRRHCGGFFFLMSNNNTFGSQQHAGDRSSILKGNAGHLGRINHASLEKVFIFFSIGIETEIVFAFFYFLNEPSSPAFSTI